VWLKQLKAQRPEMVQACRAAFEARSHDRDFLRNSKDAFAACPADSIDYAVMEKLPAGIICLTVCSPINLPIRSLMRRPAMITRGR